MRVILFRPVGSLRCVETHGVRLTANIHLSVRRAANFRTANFRAARFSRCAVRRTPCVSTANIHLSVRRAANFRAANFRVARFSCGAVFCGAVFCGAMRGETHAVRLYSEFSSIRAANFRDAR
jgi:uncharacterized protein YjbI with pentapeptide repeats